MSGLMDVWMLGWMDMRACELEYDMIDDRLVCSCDPYALGDGSSLSCGTYIGIVYPHTQVVTHTHRHLLLFTYGGGRNGTSMYPHGPDSRSCFVCDYENGSIGSKSWFTQAECES